MDPLWTLFSQGWQAITGQKASDFRFEEAPLSSTQAMLAGFVFYLIAVHGGVRLMKDRKPFKLDLLGRVHNLFLSVISGILLILIANEVLPLLKNGLRWAICDYGAWNHKLELLYYINYLIKWYELLDTAFLVLRKKPLEFLHWFHHSMTMVLTFIQLQGRTSVSWVPITLNLIVHVFMYYYYYRTAGGHRVWWKQHLTTMQITQFVIDLVAVFYCIGARLLSAHAPQLGVQNCEGGTMFAALCGAGLLGSYLLLFIRFYLITYKGRVPEKKTK